MGSTFTNMVVKTKEKKKVGVFLQNKRHTAYISEPHRSWLAVYDKKSEDDITHRQNLCKEISKELKTTVLSFSVIDSDFLSYELYHTGGLYDDYISNANAFLSRYPSALKYAPPQAQTKMKFMEYFKGSPDNLICFCMPEVSKTPISFLLPNLSNRYIAPILNSKHKAIMKNISTVLSGRYTFAEKRLEALSEILGIKKELCLSGYKYIKDEGKDLLEHGSIHIKGKE